MTALFALITSLTQAIGIVVIREFPYSNLDKVRAGKKGPLRQASKVAHTTDCTKRIGSGWHGLGTLELEANLYHCYQYQVVEPRVELKKIR